MKNAIIIALFCMAMALSGISVADDLNHPVTNMMMPSDGKYYNISELQGDSLRAMLGSAGLPNLLLSDFVGKTVCFQRETSAELFWSECQLIIKSGIVEKSGLTQGSTEISLYLNELEWSLSGGWKNGVKNISVR